MSSNVDPTTPYVSLEELKNAIAGDGPGTKNPMVDAKLLDVLQDARHQVDTEIKPYVDDVPLPPGTDTYVQAAKCVLFYAKSHWYENMGQIDRAKYNDEKFERKMEKLIESIKSDKPDRTLTIVVGEKDPLRDRTYPVSQISQYLEQEFG